MNDFISSVLPAVLFVGAVGLICALLLVIAAKFMSVKTDERVTKIRECLPGANCGACGFTGCDGYADALVNIPGTKTNLCIPGSDTVSKKISGLLGVQFEDVAEQVAVVHCNGDCRNTRKKHDYVGIQTCTAVKLFYGGDGLCTYGCLGYGDCARVCPNNAICLKDGIARVNFEKCIGCGLCAKTCPNHVIHMTPDTAEVVVTCSNEDPGAVARKKCTNACIGCKKCEKSCPEGAIEVRDNLSHFDYSKCSGCGTCAQVCPTGAIKAASLLGFHNQAN